ncbi:2Fe-2S iron-sulfur cluster-binding protein [Actibacterium sp. D379-3]
MANLTFKSPIMQRDKTVYAVAGNTKTILALADEHKVPIPFECRDGNCGSCLIEVTYLNDKPRMGMALTEKEKARLKELQKLTPEEIEDAETNDMPPRWRLACQFIARDEDVLVRFPGTPGGSF